MLHNVLIASTGQDGYRESEVVNNDTMILMAQEQIADYPGKYALYALLGNDAELASSYRRMALLVLTDPQGIEWSAYGAIRSLGELIDPVFTHELANAVEQTDDRCYINQWRGVYIIGHESARQIAAGWASGGDSLQQLQSTGKITSSLIALIDDCLKGITEGSADYNGLTELRTYAEIHGPRNPVPGWSDMSW